MTLKQLRQFMLVILLTLLGIGVVAVYSSSAMVAEATYGDSLRFVKHHLLAILLGCSCGIACLAIPYPAVQRSARWLLLASALLLIMVLVFGQEAGGAKRWFRIGRWSLQPSEFSQIALVLYLSDALARRSGRIRAFWQGLVPTLAVTGLLAGLVLVQPDLGTALVMAMVTFLLLIIANAKWQHLAGLMGAGATGLAMLIAAAPYRRARMLAFMDPWQDPQGIGYQIIQSFYAMANGGVFGVGIGGSNQKLFYLPSAHTDFLFAIVGEELGLVGALAVLALFSLFLTCGFRIAMRIEDIFSKYLVCGLVGMLGLEAMVNIGVVTGVLPTKGLPLPLMSYGGTSMIMNMIACALVFQASRHGERSRPETSNFVGGFGGEVLGARG